MKYGKVKHVIAPFKKVQNREVTSVPRAIPSIVRRSFRSLIPEIISAWTRDSKMTTHDLYGLFERRLSDCPSPARFATLCRKFDIKKAIKEFGNKEAAIAVIKTISQVRQEQSEIHERKMMKYLNRAHDVFEKKEATEEDLDKYISTASQLDHLGRRVTGLDVESKKNDPRSLGMFALINMQLTPSNNEQLPTGVTEKNPVIDV